MLIKRNAEIRSSEITPRHIYLSRREFLMSTAAVPMAGLTFQSAPSGNRLTIAKRMVTVQDALTSYKTVTTYNNFYEFGTEKEDPARNAGRFKPKPWSIAVEGHCAKPGSYTLEDILKPHPLEERVYRMRCVEGWSMVIPWVGFPMGDLLKRFEPTGNARFVEFTSVLRPDELVGQRSRLFAPLRFPYREGLRIDEAMHPLTLMVNGVYGEELPGQNGAPLRLVVPWKYGFKGIKSIVKIAFVERQPTISWQQQAPSYYAFYSNVNPGRTDSTFRDQSSERRLGEFFMRKTLMFNGYGDDVASLYAGMDLRRNF